MGYSLENISLQSAELNGCEAQGDDGSGPHPEGDGNPDSDREDDTFEPEIKPWMAGEPRHYKIPKPDMASKDYDPWKVCVDLGKQWDKDRCDAWRAEIENLLVFASLFSAIVTGFTVETFKLLRPDPSDVASTILLTMHLQLDRIARQNTTDIPLPIRSPGEVGFTAPSYAMGVNSCFFLSIVFSFSAVLGGLLCLQWLRTYQVPLPADLQMAISVRTLRLQSLEKWRVPQIISSLPLLLQASLLLFFGGLEILLWNTNSLVAVVTTAAIGVTVVFLVVTTVLPALESVYSVLWSIDPKSQFQCAFRSPQSWAFRVALFWWLSRILFQLKSLFYHAWEAIFWEEFRADWSHCDERFVQAGSMEKGFLASGLLWVASTMREDLRAVYAVLHCAVDLDPPGQLRILEKSVGYGTPDPTLLLKPVSSSLGGHTTMFTLISFLVGGNQSLRDSLLPHQFEYLCGVMNGAPRYLIPAIAEANNGSYREGQGGSFSAREEKYHTTVQAMARYVDGLVYPRHRFIPWECQAQWIEAFWTYFTLSSNLAMVDMFRNERLSQLLVAYDTTIEGSSTVQREIKLLHKKMAQYVTVCDSADADGVPPGLEDNLKKVVSYIIMGVEISSEIIKPWSGLGSWHSVLQDQTEPIKTSFQSLTKAILTMHRRYPELGLQRPHSETGGAESGETVDTAASIGGPSVSSYRDDPRSRKWAKALLTVVPDQLSPEEADIARAWRGAVSFWIPGSSSGNLSV